MSEFSIKELDGDRAEITVKGSFKDLVNMLGSAFLADGKTKELVQSALTLAEYVNKENTYDKRRVN